MARERPFELTGEPPTADVLDTPAAGPAAIRGSTLRGTGYAVGLLLGVISVPFVIRHLGVQDFGRFVLVNALITLVSGFTEGGLQAIGTREYAVRPPDERDRLMRNLVGVRLTITVIGVGGAVAFTLLAGYDGTLVLGTALAGLGLLLVSTQTILTVPLATNLRLGWITAIELGRQALTVGLILALVVIGAGLLPFFAVAVVVGVAGMAATAVLVRRLTPLRPAFHPREWWVLARDTVPYAAAIAVNIAYFRIAIVIMSLLATELQTGYFATSFRILEVLLPVPGILVGAVFPVLARAARDDLVRLGYATQRIFEVAAMAGVGSVVVLELAAPTIVRVLAGDLADPSIDVLRVQAPALAAGFVAMACGFPLLSLHRYRGLLVANLVALAAAVALCFALIPRWDAVGAAMATTTAEFALMGVLLWLVVRTRDISVSLRILGPIAGAGALGLAAFVIPAPDLVRAVLGGTVYVGTLAVLGRIPPELSEAFLRRRGVGHRHS